MKKTILATIAFAVATMPLTFAAQAPAAKTPPAAPAAQTAPAKQSTDTTKTTKKHSSKKSTPKKGTGSTGVTASPSGSGK